MECRGKMFKTLMEIQSTVQLMERASVFHFTVNIPPV